MTVTTHAGMTGTLATPAEVGAKHIRWGFGLFVFGLVIGFVPLAHYMHGSFEHGGRGIPQECHAVVGLCVDVGGLCRAARQPRHDRYRSLLCRPGAGRCNDVGHERRTHGARAVRGRHHCGGCGRVRWLLRRRSRSGRTSTTLRSGMEYGPGSDCKPSASQSTSSASSTPTAASAGRRANIDDARLQQLGG